METPFFIEWEEAATSSSRGNSRKSPKTVRLKMSAFIPERSGLRGQPSVFDRWRRELGGHGVRGYKLNGSGPTSSPRWGGKPAAKGLRSLFFWAMPAACREEPELKALTGVDYPRLICRLSKGSEVGLADCSLAPAWPADLDPRLPDRASRAGVALLRPGAE